MKASPQQQETLLELNQIDLRIKRANLEIHKLSSGAEIETIRKEMLEVAEQLLMARNQADLLNQELKRTEQDLELVDQRIQKDQARLNASSNPKDVQGIQHELVSLEKRKSDLEDIELELLTRSEVSAKTLSDIAKTREALAEKLAKAEEAVDSQIAKLKSSLSVLNQDRERASSHVGQELFEHYEKLAAKQIGVGRMSGSACPVCGILLSGSNLDEIREVPFDELAYCPECSGILLKS